jgi:IstB-like ATP binding protein
LPQELAKLDKFACVILDDIGYVQHDRDEMEVLFTFLAERYERKSVMITTNLVFSEWERIFKDPMTTIAAIDRLVHHSVILDMMSVESYRVEAASQQHLTSARSKKASPKQPSSRETALPLSAAEQADNKTDEATKPSARLIAIDGPV